MDPKVEAFRDACLAGCCDHPVVKAMMAAPGFDPSKINWKAIMDAIASLIAAFSK